MKGLDSVGSFIFHRTKCTKIVILYFEMFCMFNTYFNLFILQIERKTRGERGLEREEEMCLLFHIFI